MVLSIFYSTENDLDDLPFEKLSNLPQTERKNLSMSPHFINNY